MTILMLRSVTYGTLGCVRAQGGLEPGGTVLVVDDDPDVRESLARSLVFEGYVALTAADGRAALQRIAAERPDVVVLDIQMPVLDGLETCRRLRASGDPCRCCC
jgi:two-component system, OmpR family, response regulator MprA